MSGLRANRSWNLLLTGGTISAVGDFVFDTTMVLWIGTVIAKGQFWAPAAVSGVLIAAIVLLALVRLVVGTLNGAIQPLVLEATPPSMLGRVVAVINPLRQIATVAATAVAGLLASTALHGLHASLAGMTFGPYDTLFCVAGLLFIVGGLASIPLLRPAPGSARAGEPEVTTTR